MNKEEKTQKISEHIFPVGLWDDYDFHPYDNWSDFGLVFQNLMRETYIEDESKHLHVDGVFSDTHPIDLCWHEFKVGYPRIYDGNISHAWDTYAQDGSANRLRESVCDAYIKLMEHKNELS